MRFTLATTDRKGQRFQGGLLEVANASLNDRIGARYYGPGLTHVALSFRTNYPRGREPKAVWRYRGSFAEHLFVELVGEDVRNSELSVDGFRELLTRILRRISETSDLWQGEFRIEDLRRDFDQCLQSGPSTSEDLRQYASQLKQIQQRGDLHVLDAEEEHRFQMNRPCKQPFIGIRVYPHGSLEGKLEPNLTIYSQLLEGVLRNLKFLCPVYREIYINVAETLDDARLNRVGIEEFHENAFAVICLDDYEAATPDVKGQLVLNALATSLRELARIDHLDLNVIEQAILRIRTTGMQTDLIYLSADNARYAAQVLYRVMDDGGAPAFRLEVLDKRSGKTAIVDLGRHDLWWLPYRFGKLVLRSKEVVIEARQSQRAQIALHAEKAPNKLSFSYHDIGLC